MASIVVNGDTSGAVTLSAPAVAGTVTVTLPSTSGTMAVGGGTITTITTTSDASINGLTVGEGGGSVATNTVVGAGALALNSTGTNNTAIGGSALSVSTVGRNTAIGYVAGSATTTGHITAVGAYALYSNTTGDSNVAVGGNNESASAALQTNTTGSNNTAVGVSALQASSTGGQNTAIGKDALYANTTGSYNTAVGWQALYASNYNGTGFNTAVGVQAGTNLTTGTNSVFLGYYSGINVTTNNNCIYIGTGAASSNPTGGLGGEISIGYNVVGAGSNTVAIGSNSGKIYASYLSSGTWTQTSDLNLKKNITPDTLGLSFINRLRPVKFTWKPSNELEQNNPYYAEENKRDITTVMHGLIAQEVKAALDAEGVSSFEGWSQGADGIQGISREMFISPLIKAIQELKAELDTVKAELAALKG